MRVDEFHSRSNAIAPELDSLTEAIIGACIEVHRELGPGLAEQFYENAICREFDLRGLGYQRQVPMPVIYKGASIGEGRVDLVVSGKVIVELKAVETLTAVHKAQLVCYLKLMKLQVCLLISFNVAILRGGIKRVVNQPNK